MINKLKQIFFVILSRTKEILGKVTKTWVVYGLSHHWSYTSKVHSTTCFAIPSLLNLLPDRLSFSFTT